LKNPDGWEGLVLVAFGVQNDYPKKASASVFWDLSCFEI